MLHSSILGVPSLVDNHRSQMLHHAIVHGWNVCFVNSIGYPLPIVPPHMEGLVPVDHEVLLVRETYLNMLKRVSVCLKTNQYLGPVKMQL